MRHSALGLLAVGLWLGLAASAAALCTCGDRDGCSSAAACAGKIPGDECGKNRSCKIVVGTGVDLTCCCGCSKGVGPKACNYGTLGTIDLPAETACGSEKLDKQVTKTEAAVNGSLEHAGAACQKEKNALKKADGARGKLERLQKKIDKAAAKGKIEPACAANAHALLDAIAAEIDDFEQGGAPGGPTTTTSTTLPAAPSCSATFTAFSDPDEVDFSLGCFAAGTDYQGFQLTLNGGRQVTNYLEPAGFTCTIVTRTVTNDSLACGGNFNIDVNVSGGRIRTSPPPVSNMDASLFVQVGSSAYGPFPTTGP
jgi:hypothetical protein